MKTRMILTVVAAGLATIAVGGPASAAATTPQTRANLLDAMHGEAFAQLAYGAYADQAERAGKPDVARVFRDAARQEQDEHFAEEARLVGLVGDPRTNLVAAISAEANEATTLYRDYQRTAVAEGDRAAATLFAELADDEAAHRRVLQRALGCVRDQRRCPALPDVHAEKFVVGPARSTGQTLKNINKAMRGEAFAAARYRMFASAADRAGLTALGRLLRRLSSIERTEHFPALANLAGLVRDTKTNLRSAIAGEHHEATRMYPAYARAAAAAGDTTASERFTEIARDEAVHEAAFKKAAHEL